jgi:hypothetical protein
MVIVLSGTEVEVLSGFIGELLADNSNTVLENVYNKIVGE